MEEQVKTTVKYVIQTKSFLYNDWIDLLNSVYENMDYAIEKRNCLCRKRFVKKENIRIIQRITTEVVI